MDYTKDIEFEWDEPKSQLCMRRRGFDFQMASEVFHDPNKIILIDCREGYQEQRFLCYGHIKNRLYCLVFTMRINKIRIISARKANKREIKRYDNYLLHTKTRPA